MIVEGYGIRLIRITKEDLELVRHWRNTHHIQRFMEFREEISVEQQLAWFDSINTIHNNYFLIEAKGEKVGLINGAGIDWEKNETKSAGIFVWDDTFWETIVPISASMLLADTSILLGQKRTFIKILKDNKNAISFNKMLGYQLMPEKDEVATQHYVLTPESYLKKREKLRKMLFKHQELFKLNVIFEEPKDSISRFYIEKLKAISPRLKNELNLIIRS